MEIRNVEEIYIHYFADKSSGVTDGGGVHSKPMVFSLTQIKPENFCQEEEHFLNHQKCDELKGMQDFCQNEKTGADLTSFATSPSRSISESDMGLMGESIDNSTVSSQGVGKGADGNRGGGNKDNTTAAVEFDERREGKKLKMVENWERQKAKVKKKERFTESKYTEKGTVGSEQLTLDLESFLDLPKRRKDATTQAQERGRIKRLLGRNHLLSKQQRQNQLAAKNVCL